MDTMSSSFISTPLPFLHPTSNPLSITPYNTHYHLSSSPTCALPSDKPPPPKHNNPNDKPPNFSTGRLNEFTSSTGGDSTLRDSLATELQWSVQKYGTTLRMSSILKHELARTSLSVQEMYDKGERRIKERNDVLVLRLSVNDIGRWNEVVREGSKVCREMRGEIDAELEIVDKMLRAARKKQEKNLGRRQKNGKSRENEKEKGQVGGLVLGSVLLAGVGFYVMEVVARQSHGTQNLMRWGLWTSLPILLLACFGGKGEIQQKENEGKGQILDVPKKNKDEELS